MPEFDYETAWEQAARPLFEGLPDNVKDLFILTCKVAQDLSQDHDCNMIWPEDDGALRAAFEALDDATLATAAIAVYAYGHWGSGQSEATGGGTWKFANYADQVLGYDVVVQVALLGKVKYG